MDFLQPPRRFGLGTFVHDPDIDWPGWFFAPADLERPAGVVFAPADLGRPAGVIFPPRPILKDLPGWFSPRRNMSSIEESLLL